MGSGDAKRNKSNRVISEISRCPTCHVSVSGTLDQLMSHYAEAHQRLPTKGEQHQFRSFRLKDFDSKHYTMGGSHHPIEVSGGLPSLGKRR